MVTVEGGSGEERSSVLSFPYSAKPSAVVKPMMFLLDPPSPSLAAAVVFVQLLSHVAIFFSNPMDCIPPGTCIHGTSSKNTGVGCNFLLQGIF